MTGLLYPLHDVDRLAENILWCADHPEQAAAMAEAGYQRAKDSFSVETMVDKVHGVISTTLGRENA